MNHYALRSLTKPSFLSLLIFQLVRYLKKRFPEVLLEQYLGAHLRQTIQLVVVFQIACYVIFCLKFLIKLFPVVNPLKA